MLKIKSLILSLGLLLIAAGQAQAYCATTNVTAVNQDTQKTMILVLTLDSDPDFQEVMTVPPAHADTVEVCDTAWFLSSTSYVYTAKLYWEGESEPHCSTVFTTTTLFELYALITGCAITSGDCRSEATVSNNQGYVMLYPYQR